MALVVLAALVSSAYAQRAFVPRFSKNTKGDITFVSNSLMTCNTAAAGCTALQGTMPGPGTNNNYTMQYINIDATAGIFSSSSAQIVVPGGSAVEFAGLYWAGDSANAGRRNVLFKTPSSSAYVTVSSSTLDTFAGTNVYQGFADVTSLVAASAGNLAGNYTVANVYSNPGAANVYAGWTLVVVYSNTTLPMRNLAVYDGYQRVNSATAGGGINIALSGFLTPPVGPVSTSIGTIGYDGDRGSVEGTAGLQFGQTATTLSPVFNAVNPQNDYFNSTISNGGANVVTRNPAHLNTLGYDADITKPNTPLPNGATSAVVRVSSSSETIDLGVVTLATDIFVPNVKDTLSKRVTDLNGGAVLPGDVLEYELTFGNTGQDPAIEVILRDTLPANTTYVPNSIVITGGANAGAKTDAAGDDQAEYVAASNQVVIRAGVGANATAGGKVTPGDAFTVVRFRVTVNPGTPGDTIIDNFGVVTSKAQTLGTVSTDTSDADATQPGDQPARVIVASPDLTIAKTHTGNFFAGQTGVVYSVVVSNSGQASTSGVVTVTEVPPAGLSSVTLSGTGWACIGLSCTRSDVLAPGVSYPPIVVTANVDINAPASLVNQANVSGGSEAASKTSNNSASDTTSIVQGYPIAKSFTPSAVSTLQTSQLAITVFNPGASAMTGLAIADNFPAGLVVATSPASSSTGCGALVFAPVANATALSATGGSVAPASTCTLVVQVVAATGGAYVNTIPVGSVTSVSSGSNNAAVSATLSVSAPDLRLTKSGSASFYKGQTTGATFVLDVTNTGSGASTGAVTVVDTLPTGLLPVSGTGTGWGCTVAGQTFTCSRGDALAPNTAYPSINLTVTVDSSAPASLTNTASVSGGGEPAGNAGNNSASFNVQVLSPVTVAKAFSPGAINLNGTSTLQITLTNPNALTVTGIAFTDAYPANLQNSATPNAGTTCALGTVVAAANGSSLALSGATLPGLSSCSVLVVVGPGAAAGTGGFVNQLPSGAVTSANAGASLAAVSATLNVATPDLTVAKSHGGTFFPGQTNATFTVIVSNNGPSGNGATIGQVNVVDTLPVGMVPLSASGAGWGPGANACSVAGQVVSCNRSDALAYGASYSPITVVVQVVGSGTLTNVVEVSGGAEPAANSANNTASDAAFVLSRPTVSKVFAPVSTSLGAPVTLTIVVTNPNTVAITGVSFTDNYPAGVKNTATPNPASICGGSPAAAASGGSLVLSNATIAAGSSCTVTVQVQANSGGDWTNALAAGAVSSANAGSNAAAANATLSASAPDLVLSKTHSGPNFFQGQSTASFTITATNQGAGATLGAIEVTDVLPTGLTPLAAGGAGWGPQAANQCTIIGQTVTCQYAASLPAGATASFTITVNVSNTAPASLVNTASVVGGNEPLSAQNNNGATDTVQIFSSPRVTKAFNPISASVGQTVTLTITLFNDNSAVVTGVGVTDNFPAGLTTAGSPAASTCGAVTVNLTSIVLASGIIPANSSCQIVVAVVPTSIGNLLNAIPAGGVTSVQAGTSQVPAQATLAVGAPNLTLAKSHVGNFFQGQTTATYSLVVNNVGSGATDGSSIVVTDPLPAGLSPLSASGAGWSCGFAGQLVTCSRTGVLPGASSTAAISVVVSVDANAPALLLNTASVSGGGEPPSNSADNTVSDPTTIFASPVVTKAFAPSTVNINQPTVMSITISNPNALPVSGIAFSDIYPVGLVNASVTNVQNSCGGTATPGSGNLSLSAGTLAANASCVVSVQVQAGSANGFTNTLNAGSVVSAQAGANAVTATAILNVAGPDLSVTKSHTGTFYKNQVGAQFRMDVRNVGLGASAGIVTVTDLLPGTMVATAIAGTNWSCTLSPLQCTRSDSLAAGSTYEPIIVTVNVSDSAAPSESNRAEVSGGGEPAANTANNVFTDNVQILSNPSIVKSFTPAGINAGSPSDLLITLSNPNAVPITGVAFTDVLPLGLTTQAPATGTCGGTLSTVATSVGLSAGTIPAGGSCVVRVAVSGTTPGGYSNVIPVGGVATANAGTNQVTATAALTIAAPDLVLAKSHAGNFYVGQTTASYALEVRNIGAGSTNGSTPVTITDTLPAGLSYQSAAGTGWTCSLPPGPSVVCTHPASTPALAVGASLPVLTINVSVTSSAAVSVVNSAVVGGGGEPLAGSSNNTANDTTKVLRNPVVSKSFSPGSSNINATVRLSIVITNPNDVPMTGVAFTDVYSGALVNTASPTALSTCGGTVLATAGTNTFSLSGATIPANASCQLEVNVLATAAGNHANTLLAGAVTSGNAGSNAVAATAFFAAQSADLIIAKSHTGTFFQGQTNAAFVLRVTNVGVSASTGSTTVTDVVPSGMTLVSMSGTNWACVGNTCSRVDALPAGQSFEDITVTVNIDSNAGNSLANTANVANAGEPAANQGNNSASDTAVVLRKPTISKSFSPASMFANDVSVLTVVLSNANTVAATGVAFTDNMPVQITMASPANAVSSCGGAVTAVGSSLQLTGASIPAGASCEVRVNVTSIVPGAHANSIAAGSLTTANMGANQTATSAVLSISSPDLLLSKSHSGNFFQGQNGVTYSLVVTNNGAAPTFGVVTVTDTLSSALIFVDTAGSVGWLCANTPPVTCTRSDPLQPGSVYPPIILRVNVAGSATSFTNTASVSGGGEAPGLAGNNTAVDPTTILTPVQVVKSFTPNPIVNGQTATLRISVINLNATPVTPVNVTDTMPSQITVAGVATSSCGATVSTSPSQVLIVGATVPGSSSCTFSIPVTASAPGSWANTINTTDVTPNTSAAAQAVLTVNAPNLTLSKTHTGTFFASQQGAVFTLIASNVGNASTTGTVTVTDNLPQGLLPTAASGTGWTCSVLALQVSCMRADVLGVSAAYPAITISVNVAATASGNITNNAQIAGGADIDTSNNQAIDTVLVLRPLAMAKQFAATSIGPNQTTLLTISIINSNPVAITNIGLTDVFPTTPGPMVIAGPVLSACSGTALALSGNTGLVLSGATVAANSACTLTAVVTAATAGLYSNIIPATNLTSANAGNALADVSDAITVAAPDLVLSKSAANAPFYPGQTDARFTLQVSNIGNATSTAGSLVTVVDTMPAGLLPTSAGGVGWNCSVIAPTVTCSRSDALGIGASYVQPIQITATVAASAAGSLTNTAQLSGGGDNNAANNSVSAGFEVLGSPKLIKSFAPSSAQTGQTVLLTISLINPNSIAITGASVTDTFPANLRLTGNPSAVNTCGGILNAAPLANAVGLSGGTIPPGGCFISVDVEAINPGVFTNVVPLGALTTANGGASQIAGSATLQISAPDLRISKRSSSSFWRGQQAGANYIISVSNIGSAPTNATVTVQDAVPAGLLPVSVAGTGWTCSIAGQSVSCARPGAAIDALAAGANYPDITITVSVARDAPLSLVNTARVAGGGEPPSALANNSADDIGVVFANPTVSKRFLPGGISLGQVATLEITVANSNPAAITNVAFVDAYPAGLVNAAVPNASSGCGGVLLATPSAGAITLTSATMDANSTCVVKVDVTTGPSALPTAFVNTINAGSVTSANAGDNVAGAAATLAVASADLVLVKSHVGSFYQSQSNAVYSLQVTNQGSGNTLGTVTVSDTLPTSMAPVTATGAGWGCTIVLPRTVDCKRSDGLSAGAAWPPIAVTVGVSALATSTTNFATVSGGSEATAAASNNGTSDPTTILANPGISKVFLSGSVAINTPVTMTVVLSNSNLVPITGAAFTDVFPPNLIFAANPTVQTSCLPGAAAANTAANTLSLSGGVIPAGGSCSVSAQVAVTSVAGATNTIAANALSSSNAGSNQNSASAYVGGTAADVTTRIDLPANAPGGSTVTGIVVFTNSALATATATGVIGTVTLSNGEIKSFVVPVNLAPGGSFTATFVTTVPNSVSTTSLVGTSTVATSTPEVNIANNSAAGVLTVLYADPSVSLANLPAGVPGTNVTTTLTLSNNAAATVTFTPIMTINGVVSATAPVTLAPGASLVVPITVPITSTGATVTAAVSGSNVADTNLTNNNAIQSTGVLLADVTTKIDLPANAPGGSTVTGIVVFTNSASATATASGVVGTVTLSNGQVTNFVVPGNLAPGASFTATFVATVPSSVSATTLVGTSTVATSTPESNSANNSATDILVVLTSVAVNKSFAVASAPINTAVTLTIVLTNSNAVPITGVSFADIFPANLVLSATPNVQSTCGAASASASPSPRLVIASATVPAAGSCSVSVQVMVTAATGVTNVIAAGALTSNNGGANLVSASASLTGTVANMTVVKTHTGTFFAGQQGAVFNITASNMGSASTSGVVTVTDSLPAGFVLAGVTGEGWSCSAAGGQSASCTRADSLGVGAAYPVIQVSVNVASSATGSLTNLAQVAGGGDIDTSNNNATDTVVILANPVVTKTFALSAAAINTPVTLTLVLGNSNAVPVTGVELSDIFPANLVFATPPNLQSTCGPVNALSTPTPQLRLTGGTIPANAVCSLSAQVMLTSPSGVTNTIAKNGLTTGNAGGNPVAASASITGVSTEPTGYKSVRQTLDADGSGTVSPGDLLEWTVVYANTQIGALARANFQVSDALPAGVMLTGTPTVTASGAGTVATANPSYNGSSNVNLLAAPATLGAGGIITVRIPVRILPNLEGSLSNQALATAPSLATSTIPTGAVDNTTLPSSLPPGVIVPSGSLATTQTSGLNSTAINVKIPARIGVAKAVNQTKQINGTTIQVVYDVLVKNLGTQSAPNVQAIDNLQLSFAAPVSYVMATTPFVVSGAALPTNASFNGGSDIRLLQGNAPLPAGASALIRFALNVSLAGAQTNFNNSAFASSNGAAPNPGGSVLASTTPGGALVFSAPTGAVSTDVSNNAARGASLAQLNAAVDPSGNGLPNDADEDVPTPVSLAFAAALRGSVWLDTVVSNRQRDPSEQGIAGFGIELINASTSQAVVCIPGVNTTLGCIVMADGRSLFATNAAGNYEVIGVPVGPYRLQFRDGANNIIYGTPVNASNSAQSTVAVSRDALLINLTAGDSVLEQSLPLDPSGVVYNSAANSRAPINGAVVTLCGPAGFNPAAQLVGGASYTLIPGQATCASMSVGANGFYQYLLQPGSPSGRYTLAARATGYFGPSALLPPAGIPPVVPPAPGLFQVQPQTTPPTGSQSTLYYLAFNLSPGVQDVVNNHIPLDPFTSARLFVTKSVNQRSAEIGDSVEYTISVLSPDTAISNVELMDRLPTGFRLIPKTVRIDGVSVNDPVATSGQQTTLNLGTLSQNIPARVQYRVRIGVGAQMGDGINRASASVVGGISSNIAQAVVKVTGGVFTSDGCVVGKVFVDCNQNHTQDAGELGIPGVRFYLEDGTYLISDRDGKYSYCGLSNGTHVLKVDPRTLPEGSRMTTFSNRNVGDAESVLIDMRSGELLRADFVEGSCKPGILSEVEKRRTLLQPLGDDRNQEVKR